ncbi:carbonic anhydrase [Streptomyces subrutilus]|uniref:carbonic anhydrase n=1 Tax=Streptomyces subrutilus TaxID=36818 RepID=UPI0033DF5471
MTVDAGHVRRERRRFVRAALLGAAAGAAGLAGLLSGGGGSPPGGAHGSPGRRRRPNTPEDALRELLAGNRRWRTNDGQHPDESPSVRQTLVSGQHPFAVVLGCVDSRVPPELVFDQGLGDLLTVRSAGAVLDEAVLASIAYGVLELGIPLVVVLGHQSCGAVATAVHAAEVGGELPGHMQYLADQIRPSIDSTLMGPARVDSAITAHIDLVRGRLAADPVLAPKVAARTLSVIGARYELTDQRVHRVAGG